MTVHYFESLDSTNTYAKKLAAQGAPHGTAIVANTQTADKILFIGIPPLRCAFSSAISR